MKAIVMILVAWVAAGTGVLAAAPTTPERGSAWESVSRILKTPDVFASGYHRFNLPRRDLTLRLGDVTVAPELALGAWLGFGGEPDDAMLMGDLVLTPRELGPALAELAIRKISVTAIHNHLVGEEPRLVYVHVHAQGKAVDLATRLDRVLALTGTPRPVAKAVPKPLAIDTAAVFHALGRSGKANGTVAQVSYVLVPGTVTMHGHAVIPALGYGSPVNLQMVSPARAVATGDFAVPGNEVEPLLLALARHHIVATALHTHMIGESPSVYFIHFWADGAPSAVTTGLRAAVDATRGDEHPRPGRRRNEP
ncbi:MAG: DUF1259 domain-containing protein [Candidatus Eisenbacteria bacterium]|uniref:DUF1259 domain-containing protein n=1 Tax=Eiseniibacteriota bacterium TaxID=2212470 RepID=A0A538U2P4_UNCEI|nr:MAG: DUF1259 domain-containing protein [Candidatus Eisenbacteria bacterium]